MAITKDGRLLAQALSNAEDGLVLPSICSELVRLAKRHHRIQERWCSEDMSGTPGLTERVERQEAQLEEQIRDVAKQIPGVRAVKFTGDPRGYTVRLMLRSKKSNTWGGAEAGFGVG